MEKFDIFLILCQKIYILSETKGFLKKQQRNDTDITEVLWSMEM